MLGEEGLPKRMPTDSDLYCAALSSSSSSVEGAENTFAQVRGLQALKVRIQQVSGASPEHRGIASNEDLRLVFLNCLLLYMDPDTGSLRKSIKALVMTAAEASKTFGNGTDDIVGLVVTRFVELAWNMDHPASGDGPIGSTAPGPLPPPTLLYTQEETTVLRWVASLQWLVEIPACRRFLLEGKGGLLFGRSIAILNLLLEAAVLPIEKCHDRTALRKAASRKNTLEVVPGLREQNLQEAGAVLENEGDGRIERGHAPNISNISMDGAIDCCSEIMKTAACLMSSVK